MADIITAPSAPAAAAAHPTFPTLPRALTHEISHYLWPADIARLANTCRDLGMDDAEAGAGAGGSPLIVHGLRWFRPSRELDATTTRELVYHRLPRFKGLRILDLSGADVPVNAIEELGRLAAEEGAFRSLRVLSFYGNRLGSGLVGEIALAEALERGGFRDTLEGLYVMNNDIFGFHFHPPLDNTKPPKLLIPALGNGACQAPLRALSFAQNRLDAFAASNLRLALQTPYLKQLKKLDLHHNRLDSKAIKLIAAGLQDGGGMPCLDELYLGYNPLDDDCLDDLAAALRCMPGLRELDLSSCEIGKDGGQGIAAFAARLVRAADDPDGLGLAIEMIDVRNNKISAPAAEALLLALTDEGTHERMRPLLCPRLSAVYMDDNPAVRRPQGREALQRMQAATGITWAYAQVY